MLMPFLKPQGNNLILHVTFVADTQNMKAEELVNASLKMPWKEHNYTQTDICCAMNKLTHWLLLEIFEKLFHNSM